MNDSSSEIKPPSPEAIARKARFLILTQDYGFCRSLQEGMPDIPFVPSFVTSPGEVASRIKNSKDALLFDLLITDSIEGLNRVKQLKRHPPVVVAAVDEKLIQSLNEAERKRLGIYAVVDFFNEPSAQFRKILADIKPQQKP